MDIKEFSTKPVQAIAVLPSTHEETIASVAIASAKSLLASDLNEFHWREWLEGSFTKTVRRVSAKPSLIQKFNDDPDVLSSVHVGDAIAWAYSPKPYEDFSKHVSRLQVSGLDREKTGLELFSSIEEDSTVESFSEDLRAPIVILDSDLGMSTGKSAAQAAHGLCRWLLQSDEKTRSKWIASPSIKLLFMESSEIPSNHPQAVSIRDNGLTEIEAGSLTVCVIPPETL